MTTRRMVSRTLALACALVLVGGCGDNGGDGLASPATSTTAPYAPEIDPADFSATIDNPYLPLVSGTRRTYEADTADGHEEIVVEVTRDTRRVMGVTTIVVRDTVRLDGEIIEDTFDWFAQHRDGSVWYFGEDTHEYEGGVPVNAAGAWEAGIDGAQPGIVMPAEPAVGDSYRQEFYEGEAEDEAEVLALGETVTVSFGTFDDTVKTADTTPLEPGVLEHKYYARGVGLVFEVNVNEDGTRTELVTVEKV